MAFTTGASKRCWVFLTENKGRSTSHQPQVGTIATKLRRHQLEWLGCRRGLAVHKCETSEHSTQASFPPERSILWNDCGSSFRRPGDLKRHKCLTERAKPIFEQHGAVQCQHCHQWMKSENPPKKCVPPV